MTKSACVEVTTDLMAQERLLQELLFPPSLKMPDVYGPSRPLPLSESTKFIDYMRPWREWPKRHRVTASTQ